MAVHACKVLLDAAAAGAPIPGGGRVLGSRRTEDALLFNWKFFFTTWLRSCAPGEFRADAGAFDFPPVKHDDQGRMLCTDGSTSPVVMVGRDGREFDVTSMTGEERAALLPLESLAQIEVRGEIARVTDDDDSDWLSHLRALAGLGRCVPHGGGVPSGMRAAGPRRIYGRPACTRRGRRSRDRSGAPLSPSHGNDPAPQFQALTS